MQMACVLSPNRPRCSKRIVVHKAASFLFSFHRWIFIQNDAILSALRKSDGTCDDTVESNCTKPPQTFDYTMRITG